MEAVIAISVTGVGLTLLRLMLLMFVRINIGMFNEQVVKLVKAGNVDRAIKLCAAAPRSAYAAAIKKTLKRTSKLGASALDSDVSENLRAQFKDELEAEIRVVRKTDWIASLGVMIAVAGAVYSLTIPDAALFGLAGPLVALGLTFMTRKIISNELAQGGDSGTKVIEVLVEQAKSKVN